MTVPFKISLVNMNSEDYEILANRARKPKVPSWSQLEFLCAKVLSWNFYVQR